MVRLASEGKSKGGPRRKTAPSVDDMLELALQANLNAWEASFIRSVWDWHNSGRRLSAKQLKALAAIHTKVSERLAILTGRQGLAVN